MKMKPPKIKGQFVLPGMHFILNDQASLTQKLTAHTVLSATHITGERAVWITPKDNTRMVTVSYVHVNDSKRNVIHWQEIDEQNNPIGKIYETQWFLFKNNTTQE